MGSEDFGAGATRGMAMGDCPEATRRGWVPRLGRNIRFLFRGDILYHATRFLRTTREGRENATRTTRGLCVGGRDRAERDAMKEGNGDLFKTRKGVLLDCWILN